MRDEDRSKEELIVEVKELRRRIGELSLSQTQREDVLRENQRILSTLMSNLPGMAYRCRNDSAWTMEFVSDGCYELTGYTPSELIESSRISYSDLIHPDDRERVWNEVQAVFSEKKHFQLAYRITTASGAEKWVWEQGVGVLSPEGQVVALEGFISDITERKQVEHALRASEERYRALVQSSSDAIFMVTKNRRIASCNQAFLDLFGYTMDEILGASTKVIHVSEESYHSFGQVAYPLMEQVGPLRTEWKLKRKDGTVFEVDGSMSAMKACDGSVEGFVAIVRDITARKKVEEELKTYREHLEEMVRERTMALEATQKALVQEEKLKTLGAISAEVAHEIRNPLMSIGGFARRLKKKSPDLPEADIILKESERLEKILDRINIYLRPFEVRPEECFVNVILHECVKAFSSEMEQKHVVHQLDLDPELPLAYVDPELLTHVFAHLIKHALEIMDEGMTLAIRTYEGDQHIQIEFRNPMPKRKIQDPELLLMPFDKGIDKIGVPVSYRLLKSMGGLLSFSQGHDEMVFTVSLLKAFRPPSSMDLRFS
jgi:PAS domain S-box-containing protein